MGLSPVPAAIARKYLRQGNGCQGVDLDRKIEEAAAAHPDLFIFESLPGAGAVLAARLLAAFGSQRERYTNAEQVQANSGIAPVTERSGRRRRLRSQSQHGDANR
jgi:transposase